MEKSVQGVDQSNNEAHRASSSFRLAHDGDQAYEFREQQDDGELPPYALTHDGLIMDVSQNGFHASTKMTGKQ